MEAMNLCTKTSIECWEYTRICRSVSGEKNERKISNTKAIAHTRNYVI